MAFGSGISWGGAGGGGGGGLSPRATGWGAYADDEWTSAAPLAVAADTEVVLPNNAGFSLETQLPEDLTTFYNPLTGRIVGSLESDLIISVRLSVRPTNEFATYARLAADIGNGSPIIIEDQKSSLPWGQGQVNRIAFVFSFYCLTTFAANGCRLLFESDGPVEVFDVDYVIKRTHKGVL